MRTHHKISPVWARHPGTRIKHVDAMSRATHEPEYEMNIADLKISMTIIDEAMKRKYLVLWKNYSPQER